MSNPISQHADGLTEQYAQAPTVKPVEDAATPTTEVADAQPLEEPTVQPDGVTAVPYDEEVTVPQTEETSASAVIDRQPANNFEEHDGQFIGDYINQLKASLAEHLSEEPEKPRKFKVLYDNTTPEAMFRGMVENGPSVALVSDEAGKIFNGRGMNDLAMMNSARDGSPLPVDRVGAGSATVYGPRFSFLGMVQPGTFEKYLERRGEEARDIGFLARMFFCFPESTQGTRFVLNAAPQLMQHQPYFHARITELLEKNMVGMEDSAFTRPTLEFSAEAIQLWIEAVNEIEFHIYPGRCFADISDYGSKFGDNVARLAALIHFFYGKAGEISNETMNNALAICRWFLTEFRRIFSVPPEQPQEVNDAILIENWLAGLLRTNCCLWKDGIPFIKKNDILTSGPNSVRNKFSLDAALNYLACCNRAWVVKFGKTKFVELNLQYFTNLVNGQQTQVRASYQGLQQLMMPPVRY
jgi:hypothetical protein